MYIKKGEGEGWMVIMLSLARYVVRDVKGVEIKCRASGACPTFLYSTPPPDQRGYPSLSLILPPDRAMYPATRSI
jgi:hypothetical protein